jgi:hypothetical protein
MVWIAVLVSGAWFFAGYYFLRPLDVDLCQVLILILILIIIRRPHPSSPFFWPFWLTPIRSLRVP